MRRWYRGKEFPLPATTFEVAKVMGLMILQLFINVPKIRKEEKKECALVSSLNIILKIVQKHKN